MGVPVTSYSLGIGQEHVEFAEAKIQARIITRDLSDAEIDGLAVVAVAGGTLRWPWLLSEHVGAAGTRYALCSCEPQQRLASKNSLNTDTFLSMPRCSCYAVKWCLPTWVMCRTAAPMQPVFCTD